MPRDTFGGGFVYHLDQDRVYVGLVIGLDYRDPLFQPEGDTRSFAEYASEEKNAVSHRGRAAMKLRESLLRLGKTTL